MENKENKKENEKKIKQSTIQEERCQKRNVEVLLIKRRHFKTVFFHEFSFVGNN